MYGNLKLERSIFYFWIFIAI